MRKVKYAKLAQSSANGGRQHNNVAIQQGTPAHEMWVLSALMSRSRSSLSLSNNKRKWKNKIKKDVKPQHAILGMSMPELVFPEGTNHLFHAEEEQSPWTV